jgi:glyoxylase-like metal-dependent hydrolase (beta-lactamase superfamily II)
VSYLVWDLATKASAVIDPVLNFDHGSGAATVESADAVLAEAKTLGVKIAKILETHAHADHLSGAPYIKLKTGAPTLRRELGGRGARFAAKFLVQRDCAERSREAASLALWKVRCGAVRCVVAVCTRPYHFRRRAH